MEQWDNFSFSSKKISDYDSNPQRLRGCKFFFLKKKIHFTLREDPRFFTTFHNFSQLFTTFHNFELVKTKKNFSLGFCSHLELIYFFFFFFWKYEQLQGRRDRRDEVKIDIFFIYFYFFFFKSFFIIHRSCKCGTIAKGN